MSSSSNISQSAYSPSEPETSQGTPQSRIQNFDTSLSHENLVHNIEQSLKSAQKEVHQKRIVALRKELDYLKSTEWKFEYDKGFMQSIFTGTVDNEDDADKENFLAEQLLVLELVKKNESYTETDTSDALDLPRDTVCFQRTGVITHLENNYALIDGMLYFDIYNYSHMLNVNDKIRYLGYKDSKESIIVVRILENLGKSWGNDEDVEEDKYEVIEHVLIGEVSQRENRFVHIDDNNLKFNLDNVEGTFIPVKGDWLEMKCKIQQDDKKLSDISLEQVLDVISFSPLRTTIKHAVVTEWNGEFGTLDRTIHISKDYLDNTCSIKVGIKVIVEAIESNQGLYPWRALKLLITDNNLSQAEINQVPNDQEISLNLEKEKNISMTFPIIFQTVNLQQSETFVLEITNNSNEIYVLNRWIILSKKRDSQVSIKPVFYNPSRFCPGQTIMLTILCKPKFLGNTKECLIILFKGFQLKRFIEINVVDVTQSGNCNINNYNFDKIDKRNEHILKLKKIRNKSNDFVPGIRPTKPPAFIYERLGIYPVPEKIWNAFLGPSDKTKFERTLRIEELLPCITQELNITNYLDRWHTLLFIEEVQENIFIRGYDLPKTFLIRCQEYLGIEIKGLSEGRPSLLMGDRVIVSNVWDTSSTQYEGFVHEIRGNLVLFKFGPQFHESYTGGDVSVEFHLSRISYRKCHQAVNMCFSNLGPDVLFPRRVIIRPPQVAAVKIKYIKWFNEHLNDGQKTAINKILVGECRPLPYIIFGPPGTGKTITVIETILQILTMIPESRILVATPSNSASNLIAERLIRYKNSFSGSILRLIAYHLIDSTNISDEIKPFCATLDLTKEDAGKSKYTKKNGIKLHCTKSYIGRHRVTIGTCGCLGSLARLGFPRGHFTHLIVDEAGQTKEPEIMMPMSLIDKVNGQIILSGDPMQLGPVVLSKYCVDYGMDVSFLCRLLDCFPYKRDYDAFQNGFDSRLVTRLSDNYRSLYEVLKIPSVMFYDGSLVAKINSSMSWTTKFINATCDIFDIKDGRSGGIFVYGIKGNNTRAEDSPSWMNPQEATMLALVTCKLYKKYILANEIGIITPYIAQIKYLRLIFDSMGLQQPKIGTVEEFQGQERPIILVSTVRSSESHLLEDIRHTLGFVHCSKRLNVLITRAQVSAIIFCNPYVLSQDPIWNTVIKTSVDEEKYMGCDLPTTLLSSSNESRQDDLAICSY